MAQVTKVYNYTGAHVDFVVPDGVTSIKFELWGAAGGSSTSPGTPPRFTDAYFNTAANAVANCKGYGSNAAGYAAGTLAVTPGDLYYLYIGGNGKNAEANSGEGSGGALFNTFAPGGAGGFNGGGAGGDGQHLAGDATAGAGGGGGGATDVRHPGATLADRIIVAGGAGGQGGRSRYQSYGATANPTAPAPPYYGSTYYITSGIALGGYGGINGQAGGVGSNAGGGGGATHSAGGAGGVGSGAGHINGTAGVSGIAGAGGDANLTTAADGWINGGGGGGGGYYGGGGGSNGSTSSAAGGGGGSNHIDGAFTDALSASHAFPPSARLASGYGGFMALTYQQPPNVPAFISPLNGDLVSVSDPLVIDLSFTSEVSGVGFPTFDLRYRISPAGGWTTLTGLIPNGTTGSHTIAAGTFVDGNDYDIEARVTDSSSDTSDWSSITVSAVTPPPAPVITGPASTVSTSTFNVTWTQSSGDTQGTYEVTFLDSDDVEIYSSGVVTSAVQSHSVTWTEPSQDGMTLRVRYTTLDPDIWSGYGTQAQAVNINPPGTPDVVASTDSSNGSITLTITTSDTPNATATVDILRGDVTHSGEEIRVAAGLVPVANEVIWTDYTPADRTVYRYRVKANSAGGGFAYD